MALDLESLIQPLDPLPASGPLNPPPRPRQPLWWHVGQFISAYLPLLLMALLALATWWLVQNTPRHVEPGAEAALRHEPDYLMEGFTMQRFAPDGSLRVQLRGASMRHYPDTDTLEIDGVTIRAFGAGGSQTVATAQRALSNADASEVQLLGQAHVLHQRLGGKAEGAERVEFNSEFLHAFLATEKLKSHLPVRLRHGASELRVAALDYDHLTQTAILGGPIRARFDVPARR
jgi:lipopolysaccharide export system protein LptC